MAECWRLLQQAKRLGLLVPLTGVLSNRSLFSDYYQPPFLGIVSAPSKGTGEELRTDATASGEIGWQAAQQCKVFQDGDRRPLCAAVGATDGPWRVGFGAGTHGGRSGQQRPLPSPLRLITVMAAAWCSESRCMVAANRDASNDSDTGVAIGAYREETFPHGTRPICSIRRVVSTRSLSSAASPASTSGGICPDASAVDAARCSLCSRSGVRVRNSRRLTTKLRIVNKSMRRSTERTVRCCLPGDQAGQVDSVPINRVIVPRR